MQLAFRSPSAHRRGSLVAACAADPPEPRRRSLFYRRVFVSALRSNGQRSLFFRCVAAPLLSPLVRVARAYLPARVFSTARLRQRAPLAQSTPTASMTTSASATPSSLEPSEQQREAEEEPSAPQLTPATKAATRPPRRGSFIQSMAAPYFVHFAAERAKQAEGRPVRLTVR